MTDEKPQLQYLFNWKLFFQTKHHLYYPGILCFPEFFKFSIHSILSWYANNIIIYNNKTLQAACNLIGAFFENLPTIVNLVAGKNIIIKKIKPLEEIEKHFRNIILNDIYKTPHNNNAEEDDDINNIYFLEFYLTDEESIYNYRRALLDANLKLHEVEYLRDLICLLAKGGCCAPNNNSSSSSSDDNIENNYSHGINDDDNSSSSSSHSINDDDNSGGGGGSSSNNNDCSSSSTFKEINALPISQQYTNMNTNCVPLPRHIIGTKQWGPIFWNIFHTAAENAASVRRYYSDEQLCYCLYSFIHILTIIIPCGVCRIHYINMIKPSKLNPKLFCVGDYKQLYVDIHDSVSSAIV